MNDVLGRTPGLAEKAGKALDIAVGKERTSDAAAARNAAALEKVKTAVTGATTVKPNASAAQPAGSRLEPLKRQDGSLGATGKPIEDFGKGTPAILHGREGVITESQLNGLMGSAAQGGGGGGGATLDEVTNQLAMLNSSMAQLVSHTMDISEASSKTAKHSSKLTGNRAA
jgi:hypothetical protein